MKVFFIFLFQFVYAGSGVKSYFSAAEFGNCLSQELSQEFNLKDFEDKIAKISSLRERLSEKSKRRNPICRQDEKVESSCNNKTFAERATKLFSDRLFCFVEKNVVANLMFHSLPLVLQKESEIDSLQDDQSDWDWRYSVKLRAKSLEDWLLKQQHRSVSHWELFKQAKEIYKDSFIALGIIGEIFDREREYCDRRANCELAFRMKPLLYPADDPVGHNYHFWANLNMVLNENGTPQKLASYGFEVIHQKDYGDHAANMLGIETSIQAVRKTRLKLKSNSSRTGGLAIQNCKL